MRLGLAGAPSTFHRLIQSIFLETLYAFVSVYLSDVLVFSSSREEHPQHLRHVLKRMREQQLSGKLNKCDIPPSEDGT